jgi:hypothetical protein
MAACCGSARTVLTALPLEGDMVLTLAEAMAIFQLGLPKWFKEQGIEVK